MYQRVVIVGNLGRDPEMRYTAGGTAVVHFPVATNRKWNDTDGNAQEETTWFRVTVWGKQAEICNQYLEKGRLVLCDGEIRTSQYDDQQGVTRHSWELRAMNVKFLAGSGAGGSGPAFDALGAGDGGPSGDMTEDDIPF